MSRSASSNIHWVRRVNRTWIVHAGLDRQAESWLDYLEQQGDPRLAPSCDLSKKMSSRRDPSGDPKPWFYAGLFGFADHQEARRFLARHPVTQAAIPSMVGEEDIEAWLQRLGPQTKGLLAQLRQNLTDLTRQVRFD